MIVRVDAMNAKEIVIMMTNVKETYIASNVMILRTYQVVWVGEYVARIIVLKEHPSHRRNQRESRLRSRGMLLHLDWCLLFAVVPYCH